MSKTEEIRARAKLLLEQAKKIEEEATLKLGTHAAKFLDGQISLEDLRGKAHELGFNIKGGQQ